MSEMIDRVAAALRTNKASLSNPEAESLARAAVSAMREPTEAMIEKGVWSRSESGRYAPRDIAITIYQAMIDAARTDPTPPR